MPAEYTRLHNSERAGISETSIGYCAVYRPSLTDSKLRSNNWSSLRETYQLVPTTQPKRRAWCENGDELHLEHQLYAKEQGRIRFVTRQHPEGWEVPRLGVQITINSLDFIDPVEERWKGKVSVALSVATQETLGMQPDDKDNLRRYWCFGDLGDMGEPAEDDDQFSFLCKAFGFRFVNLVREDSGELVGPKRFSELEVDSDYIQGTWSINGVFSNPVDLSYFPFDSCSWDVIVSVIGASPGVRYDWSALRNFREFEVMGMHGIARPTDNRWYPYACEQILVPNSARNGENVMSCRFYSRRKPAAKLFSIVMPTSLSAFLGVVTMLQSSGWVRNQLATTDPIALQGGLLLTVIAIKFSSLDSLPKGLGASTLFDKFFLACILLQVSSMLCCALITVEELNAIRAPWIYVCVCILFHLRFAYDGAMHWCIFTAPKGQKIYTVPHQEDELRDEEYLWPGQQEDIHKAHISFAQKKGSMSDPCQVHNGFSVLMTERLENYP